MGSSVIVKNPAILGGVPVFLGTRVPFQALLDYIEGGQTLDAFLDHFPTVTREAAIAALEEAKALVLAQLKWTFCLMSAFRALSRDVFYLADRCLTVPEAGFAGKTNGELLRLAQGRFDVFITLDKGLPHQQNLANLAIAVIVVRARTNQMDDVLPHVPECLDVLDVIKASEVRYVGIWGTFAD
jgi:uncharacterized protein (DUF433 family)